MEELGILPQLLERHRAFWQGAQVRQPLVGRVPARTWAGRPFPLRDGRVVVDPTEITAQDIDVARMVGADRPRDELLFGDLIRPLAYRYPQAWMEALVGCSIHVSTYGCVAKPAGTDLERASRGFSVDAAMRSDWVGVMDRVLHRAGELAGATLPVRQLHLRGIVDMLAAFLGEDRLCTAVYDHPREIGQLSERFADLYIAMVRRGLALRSPWHGGYVSMWNLYAPGPNVDYQVDASSLFSANAYREHFLEHDARILVAFPYSVIHLHACGLHILDALLTLEQARAFQINLDRETGHWDKDRLLAWCRRIQAAGKGIVLHGELSEDELANVCSTLSPNGLAIFHWAPARCTDDSYEKGR